MMLNVVLFLWRVSRENRREQQALREPRERAWLGKNWRAVSIVVLTEITTVVFEPDEIFFLPSRDGDLHCNYPGFTPPFFRAFSFLFLTLLVSHRCDLLLTTVSCSCA